MSKLKEYRLPNYGRRYIGKTLDPNRVDSWCVRARSAVHAAELLRAHTPQSGCVRWVREYALFWGNTVDRPQHEGCGVWLIRDPFGAEMIEVWTDKQQ